MAGHILNWDGEAAVPPNLSFKVNADPFQLDPPRPSLRLGEVNYIKKKNKSKLREALSSLGETMLPLMGTYAGTLVVSSNQEAL